MTPEYIGHLIGLMLAVVLSIIIQVVVYGIPIFLFLLMIGHKEMIQPALGILLIVAGFRAEYKVQKINERLKAKK